LLNVAGKVLDRLIADSIVHHVHTNAGLNSNQYGFIIQRGSVDAGMAFKEIIEENLKQKNCTSVVNLGVRGEFDAARWPSILLNLKELKCSKNIFNLSRVYFSDRMASLRGNTLKTEKPVTLGCPKVSCSGPGFWNILYNTLLNMDFSYCTRAIAFAKDLMVITRRKSALDVENYANQDLKKIENWVRENKMKFNEKKSNVLLVTTKISGGNRNLNIYLNNKRLDQESEMKYLRIYFKSRISFLQICRLYYREMQYYYKYVSKIS